MHLTKLEIQILRSLDFAGRKKRAVIDDELKTEAARVDHAVSHLMGLEFVTPAILTGESGAAAFLKITADGREALREHDHVRKKRLYWVLEKLVFSVLVPVLVAGAIAYYVAWVKVKIP